MLVSIMGNLLSKGCTPNGLFGSLENVCSRVPVYLMNFEFGQLLALVRFLGTHPLSLQVQGSLDICIHPYIKEEGVNVRGQL